MSATRALPYGDGRFVNSTDAARYRPVAASALAFDPPVGPGYPLLGLDRDARAPGAFIGYQDSTTETFASGLADVQSDDPSQNVFYRWSSSVKEGVRYR